MRSLLVLSVFLTASSLFAAEAEVWSSPKLKSYAIELAPNLNEQHYALERLGDFGSHYVLMLHREGDGPAEVHDGQTDFYVVQAGSATLHIGGEVVGGKTTEPGEIRGKSLKGAKTRKIAAGDVINIPAKLPHQITVADGETITYLIVKVHAK